MYQNPEVESSYRENNLGKTLYDQVIEHKPKTIVEFGCLYGYSTIAMAMALRDLGQGMIYCYDLWEEYDFKHSTLDETMENLKRYDLLDFVEFKQMNFYDWLLKPTEFDLLHLDISNTGDTIFDAKLMLNDKILNGKIVLFEGGSTERDQIDWMNRYKALPINSVKGITGYEVINQMFPSISKF